MPGAEAPTPLRVRAMDAAGGLDYWAGELVSAHARYEDELALARRIGDRPGVALALLNVFFTREYQGDLEGAVAARREAEAIYRELGDDFGLARIEQSGFLILLAKGSEDPEAMMTELEVRAAAAEALTDPWLSRIGPAFRGFACLKRGDVPGGLAWLVRALRADLFVRERAEAALGLQFAVIGSAMSGAAEVGATIHGAAQAAFEQLGVRPPAGYEDLAGFDPIPDIRDALGPEGFEEAVARGRRLSLEEAVDLIEEVGAGSA